MFLSPANSPSIAPSRRSAALARRWLVCLALTVAIFAAYGGIVSCDFVDYDDPDYILNNHAIQNGFTWHTITWAFTSVWAANWHPLTWLSHALDFSLFGLHPLGYHLENVFWHAANSVLLLLWLEYLTGAFWRSAVIAAFFALHPLHVESVAWIAERKDLLSTVFWIVTVWLYTGYVRAAPASLPRKRFYAASLLAFVLALLCKPMVVTLPFVLLLLDFWPLRRPGATPWARLILEKTPFFLLAFGESVVTFIVQKKAVAMSAPVHYPWSARLENIPISYFRYFRKTFWPSDLTMYYKHTRIIPLWMLLGCCLFLIAVTLYAWSRRRSQSFLLVGWLWFLGILVPTIGLVQVGEQSMADRYSYLPSVGLFIAVTWLVADWLAARGQAPFRQAVAVVTAAVLLLCAALTSHQVGYWRDTGTLFRHATDVDGGNYVGFYNLACWLTRLQKYPQAEACLERCLQDNPDYPFAYNNLAFLQIKDGHYDQAITNLQRAIDLHHNYADAYINLARAQTAKGQTAPAIQSLETALKLNPSDTESRSRLGDLLVKQGEPSRAVSELQTAADAQPSNPQLLVKLADAQLASGRISDAVNNYESALKLNPNLLEACNNLAWIMAASPDASLRDGVLAVSLAGHAVQLTGGQNPLLLGTYAAACAEAGRFDDAVRAASQARQIALTQTNAPVAASLERQILLYKNRQPFRDAAIHPTGP